jgi:dTDP-4-dehydrorhamnose reductase
MAKASKAWLVHYSTDYVYDGQKQQPYREEDVVNPMSVYGASKLAGDQAIQAIGGHYLIFRTAWVYGRRGQNFLLTMQRLAKERDELRIVNDQKGTPTWSKMIAEATVQVLAQLNSPLLKVSPETCSGIYHLTCGEQTTWYEFAKAIIAHLDLDKPPRILPITTVEYPTPAKRPAYSVLSNAKLTNTFGITLPAWDKALELCLTTHF